MATRTSFISGTKSVSGELFTPAAAPNGGVVVIAHGSDGMVDNEHGPWKTIIRQYADGLASDGIIAFIPNYFESTGTQPKDVNVNTILAYRDPWQAALADALAYAKRLPGADAAHAGLVGFSLGGHLALRLRAEVPVLVALFAPLLDGLGSSNGRALRAQLHHGRADPLVRFELNASPILETLKGEKASVELFDYVGAGHGFGGSSQADMDAREQSKKRTLSFFAEYL